MSRTGTNVVRFAVAALLGLAACLVAWWPQSAAGSGEVSGVAAVAMAEPTQKTPTPTKTPTATVGPTSTPTATVQPTSAPQPTHKPTHKPTPKPTHKPTTLHNDGGSHSGSNHNSGGSPTHAPAATHTTSAPYVPPPAATTAAAAHTSAAAPKPHTPAPSTQATEAVAPSTPSADPKPSKGEATGDADTYDTYLTSSAPVEAKSAPVWVVPGILLVLTSMLALLGGVLGRGNRAAPAPVKASNETSGGDES